jgi:DHA1 family multidrug resistance protein-like MFS transporter
MTSWKRTYWVVFVSNLITAIGMLSFLPFFPAILEELGVEDLGERMVWSGVLFGAAPLVAAVMGPIWGSIGDRVGRKLMVVRALVAIALFVGLMGLARSPVELLLLRLGQGVFSGFIPPSITLVSVVTPRELQGRVTGSLQAALPAGMITGPLVGDLIQSSFGMSSVFFFVAAAAGLSALLVVLFAQEDPTLRVTLERFSPTSVLDHAWQDLRRLFASADLRWAIGVLFVVQFGLGATNPQLQLFVESIHRGDPERVTTLTAWLFSAMAASGLLATTLWGGLGDRIGHRRSLLVAALASALFLGLHAAAAVYAVLFACRIAIGLVSPGVNVAAFGLAAVETADENRGGAFGAVFSARALAVSIGAMTGGALSSAFGLRALFVLFAASTVLLVLVAGRAARR